MSDEDIFESMLRKPKKVEVEEPSKYPFHVGKYDLRMRDRIRESLPPWPELVNKRKGEFAKMDDFLSTTLFALFKPEAIPVSPLTEDAQKMARVLEIAERMPEWKELKERVTNNFSHSALATMVIGEHVVFPEDPPGGNGDQEGDGDGDEDGDGNQPGNMNDVRRALAKAVKEAKQGVEDAETLEALWGDELGEDVYKDAETLYNLLKMLGGSDRLRAVAKLLGRLKNQMTRSQMAKSTYVPEETVDITLGNDLRNILPNGRLLMADEDLQILFLLKYVQRALLQQHKEGREPIHYGPIVVMMDISGSMETSLGDIPGVGQVTRLDWAVAVGLALSILAKQQNRDCYIGAFDTNIRKEFKTTDPELFNVKNIVELLSLRGSGGTSFEVPLSRSLDIMTESEFRKADLVFITDGECHISEKFLEEYDEVKEEIGFRTLGVVCGTQGRGTVVDAFSNVAAFSNRVMRVDNMVEADRASDVLFQIGS